MAGNIFDSINPLTTSGTQLATILNDFKDAVASGFSTSDGNRPANLNAGGYWVDMQNDPIWVFSIYDGAEDTVLFEINSTTNSISFGTTGDKLDIQKSSDDALGAALNLLKRRATGAGQTLDGDTIGEVNFVGFTDATVEEIMAKIEVVATDNVTGSEHGSELSISTTADAGATLTERVRIKGDGKVGFGTNVPDEVVHVEGNIKSTLVENSATGPKNILNKKRTTGSGQVLNADEIGSSKFTGTDEAGAEIDMGLIQVKATEDSQSTQHGSEVSIQTVKTGETALADRIKVDGLGDTDISGNLDVQGTGTSTIAGDLEVTGDVSFSGTSDVTIPGNLNVDGVGESSFDGNLTVAGDLTINGTTTTVNTDTLDVEDANVTINKNGTEATADAQDAGITVEMSDATNAQVGYDSTTTSKFKAGEVGSESEIATLAHVQTLTNKTLTSPDINGGTVDGATLTGNSNVDPTRMDVKKDSTVNLETYAATATEGQIVYSDDEKKYFGIAENELKGMGGGVGSPSLYQFIDADDIAVSKFDTTGLTNVTVVVDTVTFLSGKKSFKVTQVAGGVGEKFFLPQKTLPKRARDAQTSLFRFVHNYDGDTGDYRWFPYDVTNDEEIKAELFIDKNKTKQGLIFDIPATCLIVAMGCECMVENTSSTFHFDDTELDDKPFGEACLQEENVFGFKVDSAGSIDETKEYIQSVVRNSVGSYTVTFVSGFFTISPIVISDKVNLGSSDFGIEIMGDVTLSGFSYKGKRPSSNTAADTPANFIIKRYGADYKKVADHVLLTDERMQAHTVSSFMLEGNDGRAITSDTEDVPFLGTGLGWTASGDNNYYTVQRSDTKLNLVCSIILTSGTTNSILLYLNGVYYKRLQRVGSSTNIYMGTYMSDIGEFTKDDTLHLRLDTGGTLSNSNANHYLNLHEEYVPPSTESSVYTTVALPASKENRFFATFDSSGDLVEPYNTTLIVPTWSSDRWVIDYSGLSLNSKPFVDGKNKGNEKGSAIFKSETTTSCNVFLWSESSYAKDPFSISLDLAQLDRNNERVWAGNVPKEQVMIVEDVKGYHDDGGSAVAGWQTRAFNTISGDLFGSLDSYVVTIPKGEYLITGKALAYAVNRHFAKLVGDPNGTPYDIKVGTPQYASAGDNGYNESIVKIRLSVDGELDIDLQHYIQTAKSGNGLGLAHEILDHANIYASLEIRKLS